MARETKVGLLLGLALILLVGIILSDLMQPAEKPSEGVTGFAEGAQVGIYGEDPFGGQPAYDARYEQVAVPAGRTPDPVNSYQPVAPANPTATDSGRVELPSAWRVGRSMPEAVESAPVPLTPSGVPVGVSPGGLLPGGTGFVHYVKPGQSMADIAQAFYGNPAYAKVLARFNADALDRDGETRPGARVEIPALGSSAMDPMIQPSHADHAVRVDVGTPDLPEMPRRSTNAAAPARTLIVEPGATLSGLAATHLGSGTRWRELLDANRDQLDAPEDLRSGMTLRLPDTISTPGTPGVRASARMDSPMPTPAPTDDAQRTYTVKAGDNLTLIARQQLDDGERWRDILEANRDLLASADDILVGMTLRLPGKPITPAVGSTPAPGSTPTPPAASAKTYRVQAGDSLFKIAQSKLGDGERWRELLAANRDRLDRPEDLQAGIDLRLP